MSTVTNIPSTHKAVRLHGAFDIQVETIPAPKVEHEDDAIVKVTLAGLCGSDLHAYRGHEQFVQVFTTGHEFVGTVVALGSSFSSSAPATRPALYGTLKVGDKVVSPFSISCGECQSCRLGFSSRCIHSLLLGHPRLEGAQAQYVRIPNAGGTLFRIPSASETHAHPSLWSTLPDTTLLLLADILPTGCFAALQMLQHPKIQPVLSGIGYPMSGWVPSFGAGAGENGGDEVRQALAAVGGLGGGSIAIKEEDRCLVVAIVGLGPVGVCATIALLTFLARTTLPSYRVLAIDTNAARRASVEKTLSSLGVTQPGGRCEVKVSGTNEARGFVDGWTNGVGCNAVLEVVGHASALTLAHSLLRPFGVLTSVGVHQTPPLPFTGTQMYGTNIGMEFGRCPVRAMFPIAVGVLLAGPDSNAKGAEGGGGSNGKVLAELVERVVGIDEAATAFKEFEGGNWGKVCLDPWA